LWVSLGANPRVEGLKSALPANIIMVWKGLPGINARLFRNIHRLRRKKITLGLGPQPWKLCNLRIFRRNYNQIITSYANIGEKIVENLSCFNFRQYQHKLEKIWAVVTLHKFWWIQFLTLSVCLFITRWPICSGQKSNKIYNAYQTSVWWMKKMLFVTPVGRNLIGTERFEKCQQL